MFKPLKTLLGIGLERTVADEVLAFQAEKASEAARDPELSRANARLERRLVTASLRERQVAALAAPYRESYLDELTAALWDGRSATHLFTTALPPQGMSDMAALLNRDFQLRGGEDVEWVCDDLVADYDEAEDRRSAVVYLAQAAHVATAASGVDYLPLGSALRMGDGLVRRATASCTGWADYGDAFLASERRTNTDREGRRWQRRYLSDVVGQLLINPLSPWKVLDWPGEGE